MTKLSIALMSISITLSPLAANSASKDFGLSILNFKPLIQKNEKNIPNPLNDCGELRFPECEVALTLPEEPGSTTSNKDKIITKMYKKRKDSI